MQRTAVAGKDAQLASRLRMNVMRVARRLRQQDTTLDGITMSQLSALAIVERYGPMTLGALAEAERVQPPTMTKIVERLAQLGWVERTVDPTDRRFVVVSATTAGRTLVAESRGRRTAYLAAKLRTLGDEDRAVLARAADIFERMLEDD